MSSVQLVQVPRNYFQAITISDITSTLSVVEELKENSEEIVHSFNEGEAYETIQRQVFEMNQKLSKLSTVAKIILKQKS